MRIELQPGDLLLRLAFASDEELADYLDRGRGYGLTVRLEERLEEGQEYRLELSSPGHRLATPAKIKQIFRSGVDRWGTIFAVDDESALELGDPAPPESTEAVPPESTEAVPPPAPSPPSRPAAVPAMDDNPVARAATQSEARGVAPVFDIRQMNPNERMRLASRANRQERQVLLRDGVPQVLMNLLNNPGIELKEVVELIKNPQVSAGVLKRISQDRRWSSNYEIQLTLVRNPKTPTPIAVRFVDLLRVNDLRDLAKSQAVRDEVKQAALRRYLQRSQ